MNTCRFRASLFVVSLFLVCLSALPEYAQAQISATISWEFRGGHALSTYGAGPNPSGFDTIVAFNLGQQRWTRPCMGDVDGDGDVDMIQCSREGKLYYYENIGTPTNPHWGRRAQPTLDTVHVGRGQPSNELHADLADLDADGDLDLIIGSRWTYNTLNFAFKLDDIHYLENQGTPTNPVFVKVDEGYMGLNNQQCGEFSGLTLVDIDADNDLDLLSIGSDSGAYFINVGDSANPNFSRQFGAANLFDSLRHHYPARPHLTSQPQFADFDADGDLDLYAGDDAGQFGYYENIGTASAPNFRFQGWLPMHGGMDTVDLGQFTSLQLVDVTNDGILDIVTGQFTPAHFTWWEGVVPGPVVSIAIDSNVTCNGLLDGGLTANVSAGTTPYTYLWSTGTTNPSITALAAGPYTVTVTDNAGISAVVTESITQPTALGATVTVDNDVSCNGLADGSLTASGTGGTTAYTYAWSNTATIATANGLGAATYTVTITDANGCTASNSESISQPTALMVSAVEDSSATCPTCSDGGATASASGGTSPYTYSWNNAATTASITGVLATTYTVSVTDNNGCTGSTTVAVTAGPIINMMVDSNVSCNGFLDGGLTANVSSGTTPYTYAWSNTATNASITGIAAATYIVTVTDAAGLSAVDSATVAEPAVLVATVAVDSNVTCNGLSNGGATVSASGGTSAYTYAWSNTATTASITGVVASSYTVTVTDANGCTLSDSDTITEPAALVAAAVEDSSATCLTCPDGGATASAMGGTSPYTYSWSNSATTASITGVLPTTYTVTVTDNNGCTDVTSAVVESGPVIAMAVDSNVSCNGFLDAGITAAVTQGTTPYTYLWSNTATNASITGIAAGTYIVTVTDAAGLSTVDSATVTEPTVLVATVAVDSNVTCNGLSNGGATVSASGGTSAYTYAWSNIATTASITGVVASSYTVTVTDANGCTLSDSDTITEPAALVAAAVEDSSATCLTCPDGGATASAMGGTSPYTYGWSNSATTASITGVVASTYTVTVTDNNGCTDVASAAVESGPVIVMAVDSNASCNAFTDAGITAGVTQGTTPYTYLWSNTATNSSITGVAAGTYTVTVTDAAGLSSVDSVTVTEPDVLTATATLDSNVTCNGFANGGATIAGAGGTTAYTYAWSNAATTASITGIVAGSYTATISDANGCTAVDSVTITEPTMLVGTAVVDSAALCPTCPDGGATASATGGTTAYTYAWSNSATTASITGVIAGTYTVTISDANGCTASDTAAVLSHPVIALTVDSNANCNGFADGGITAGVTAGTTPYTYAWSNTATSASITGVAAATYTVTVTDAAGLTSVDSTAVTEPMILTDTVALDSNATCNGALNGGATVTATGGTMAYTYVWSNSATTASITGVAAGTYSVTTTDANGCSSIDSVTITEPTVLTVATVADSSATCLTCTDGGASASATGGTTPYSYAWSNAATTASITGVLAGTYSMTVTDANGCTASDSVVITAGPLLAMAVDSNASCHGFANGGASSGATSGTAPLSYLWSTNDTTASIAGLAAGTYTVTVTDAIGLTAVDSVAITEPLAIVLTTVVDSNATCNGVSDGGATASATGGVGSFAYSWSNADSTASIAGIGNGTYFVIATDSTGCTAADSASITEPALLSATAVENASVSCNGLSDGAASASATGGTMPYDYSWPTGAGTDSISGLAGGTYTVIVSDTNGCVDTAMVVIAEPDTLLASASIDANVSCNGDADGSATATVTGGTLPYSYSWNNGDSTATTSGLPAGTYSLTITDANGCTDAASLSIVEPTALVASIDSVHNANCAEGSDGNAFASADGGTLPYTWLWPNGDANAVSTGLAEGAHTTTVTDANGCETTAEATIGFNNALPVVDLGPDVNVNTPTAALTAPTGFVSYLWSNGSTTESALASANGAYSVIVTDTNGCEGTDTLNVTVWPAGIGSANSAEYVTAWPNPTAGVLNIATPGMHNLPAEWSIMSIDGSVIQTGRFEPAAEAQRGQINVHGLAGGTYLLRVSSSTSVHIVRLAVL